LTLKKIRDRSVRVQKPNSNNLPVGITLDANGKILGHEASFDGLNADVFQSLREVSQLSVVVQLGAVSKTSGPGKDGGNRVGAGFLAL
jgi:hypothetical protein